METTRPSAAFAPGVIVAVLPLIDPAAMFAPAVKFAGWLIEMLLIEVVVFDPSVTAGTFDVTENQLIVASEGTLNDEVVPSWLYTPLIVTEPEVAPLASN